MIAYFRIGTWVAAALAALSLSLPAFAAENPSVLVWSDEFETPGLPDPGHWNWDTGGSGNGNQEGQYYTRARPANAHVDSGYLQVTARREDTLTCWYGPCKFTSARLVTRGLATWTYGKVEVRARLPTGKGLWPAIWMLPQDNAYGNWPNSGEIDIMENVGFEPGIVHGTVHTQDYNHLLNTQRGATLAVDNLGEVFHVYGLEWGPDSLSMAVDGRRYFSFARETGSAKWPFDKPFYLLVNIAVGGSWGGQQGVDTTVFPQSMLIDWVRVYQASPQTGLRDAGSQRESRPRRSAGDALFIQRAGSPKIRHRSLSAFTGEDSMARDARGRLFPAEKPSLP